MVMLFVYLRLTSIYFVVNFDFSCCIPFFLATFILKMTKKNLNLNLRTTIHRFYGAMSSC